MKKKLTALVLFLAIIISAIPSAVFADGKEDAELGFNFISEIPDDDEEVTASYQGNGDLIDETIYISLEDAGLVLREALSDRAATLTVSWVLGPTNGDPIDRAIMKEAKRIYNYAVAHTGNPYEGDYLSSMTEVRGALNQSYTYCRSYYEQDGQIIAVGTFILFYFMSDEQDMAFKNASDEAVSIMDLDGKSDYEKLCAAYGYIINHVRYRQSSNAYKAYGPLVEGFGVCDGVAHLVYHLMLRAGIDCRYIVGYSGAGYQSGVPLHAWNIVELDGLWYNVDATFDLRGNPSSPYYNTTNINGVRWLLRCDYTFMNNRQGIEYHGHKEGCCYYPDLERSVTDYGEGMMMTEGVREHTNILPGERTTLIFVPSETGTYMFYARSGSFKMYAEADPYFYDEELEDRMDTAMDPLRRFYDLEAGHRYYFDIYGEDSGAGGDVMVCVAKMPKKPIVIVDINCKSLHYYDNSMCADTSVSKISYYGVYKEYDVRPKEMAVLLSDGTEIHGSFDKILHALEDKYLMDIKYAFIGNDQTAQRPWKEGRHTIIMVFDGFEVKYDVVIESGTYVNEYCKAKFMLP